jgi:hypothetical protein
MSMRRAARAVPVLAVLALAAGPLPSGAGTTQATSPRITLIAPANGSLVRSSAELRNAVTFQWRVDWPQPSGAGAAIVSVKWATDPGFTQNVSGANQTCPVANLNCWTTFRPNHTWAGRYYWKVEIAGLAQHVSSSSWRFTALEPARQFDRVKPYVRTFHGGAKRGRRAFFFARIRDNSGEARILAVLIHRGLPVLEGNTPYGPVSWRVRRRFHSIRPLSRRLPAGIYKICITAWDRAGNTGRSCARYRIR